MYVTWCNVTLWIIICVWIIAFSLITRAYTVTVLISLWSCVSDLWLSDWTRWIACSWSLTLLLSVWLVLWLYYCLFIVLGIVTLRSIMCFCYFQFDRLCLNCNLMEQIVCECPCECRYLTFELVTFSLTAFVWTVTWWSR